MPDRVYCEYGVTVSSPHEQNSFDEDDIVRCGQGSLFGPGYAQLPKDEMLMVDRITQVTADGGAHGRGLIVAEMDIDPSKWFFGCHFVGDPVMPGCLGLDAMWQLTGFFLAWRGLKGKGRALGVKEVRFSGQVLPTSGKVTYRIDVRRVIQRKLIMGIADGTLSVDNRDIYHAQSLRVGFFTDEELSNQESL